MELSKHITGKKKSLEFKIPDIVISRNDSNEMRNKIIAIDPYKRKELKINKSTLWYQQKRIKEGKTIKIYNKTKLRIESGQDIKTKIQTAFRILYGTFNWKAFSFKI